MANDRELSDAERVWIISRVINTKGLNGLLEEIAAEFKTTTIPGLARPLSDGKELPKPIFINNSEEQVTTISTPSKASIYRESAKDLVEQDRREHPVVSEESKETIISSETIEPLTPSPADNLEEKPKVLERKLNNNPWSGIETVSPGQLKL